MVNLNYRASAGALALLLCTACGGTLKETPPTDDTAAMLEAWAGYYAAIADLQDNLLASDSFKIDDAHRAGAIQLMQSIIASNVVGAMGGGDGSYPHIRLLLSPTIKIGVDNPDTLYRAATISNPDGAHAYRVWGQLGTASDFLLEQFYGPDPQGAISTFEDDDLIAGEDGSFEIFLSAERMGENWMELAPTDRLITLIIRDSFTDWATEQPATVEIERIGTDGEMSPPLRERDLIHPIEQATEILERQGRFWPDFSSRLRLVGENNFIDFRATESLGIPTQFFSAGFFSIAQDEALIVTIPDVNAAYCGFQVANFWAASPDWINRQTSLSWCNDGAQAAPMPDGGYQFVVSPRDPGVHNWIDTAGLSQGVLYARIQSPKGEDFSPPEVRSELVKLNALEQKLEPATVRLDAQARKRAIAARQAHARRRYQAW
ncbi:MAG: hypothetical protein F4229_10805 [Gammaproteobacteria bacterium]|nr:hypothetical protein [Gammaproteobacteria bacterium]